MARIVRARHVGYSAAGVPIVRNLPDVTCLPLPEFLAFRHAGYTAAGLPLAAYAWACCDAYCTDEEVSGETCYVEAECWPFGPGPGIARRLTIYMVEVTNCVSGRRKKAVLEYDDDPTSPAWVGEIELRDKTIELRFTCNPVPDPDANDKFTLSWSNCASGSQSAGYTCQDPLRVDFVQIPFNECCDCPAGVSGPTTDVTSVVNFIVVANCQDHPVRFVRHVGYTAAGIPIVAQSRDCAWNVAYEDSCAMMRCGIVAEVSAEGDCACMDGGVYDLTYTELAEAWGYTAAPAECGVIAMAVTCVNLGNGLHRLTVTLSCDEYNTGTGFVDVTPDELEDLDVEVPVTIVWAGSPPDVDEEPHCCTGAITVRLIRP